MSKYYITAHNNGKAMQIAVEAKHQYYHQTPGGEAVLDIHRTDTTSNPPAGYTVQFNNIKTLWDSNITRIAQGTGEDQRVGNKVNIKSINTILYIYLIGNSIINKFSHSEAITMTFNFRIMCVKFKEAMNTSNIADWYQKSFIYYRTVPVSGGTSIPFQSNWMDKLRESTDYTGSFKILYDKKFTLGKNHTTAQMNIPIPFKGSVNFDNDTNAPTSNQEFDNIYCFLIGPSNHFLDMDCISQDKVGLSSFTTTGLAYLNTNTKIKYYDM